MPNFISAVERHWQARQDFAGSAGWLTHLYDRLLRRAPELPLPGRARIVRVALKGHPIPYLVRLGSTDMLVLDEVFRKGEYKVVETALKNVHRIVDLGANVGFSLRYWHTLFPQAKILAVEPEPENVRL